MRREMSRALARVVGITMVVALVGPPRDAKGRPSLTVDHGELVLAHGGGELRSADLVGSTVRLGALDLRLDGITRVRSPRGDVVLHDFSLADGTGKLCLPDGQNERWAIAVTTDAGVELACTSGARGKCARFGYDPSDPSLVDLHAACVRMMRADYGGDGTSATREGIGIRFCDRAGVFPCPSDARLVSAWSHERAVCVARPRVADLADLATLASRHPHLRERLGDACSFERMDGDPQAILFEHELAP
jgi:hypothetical protein